MALTAAQEIRVGVIATLSVVLLVAGIVWAKGIGIGTDSRSVTISFANASGVEPGTAVTVNGVRVGAVTAVEVRPNNVLVSAIMSNKLPLKSDATATLAMLEITGGKKIEIDPGEAQTLLPADALLIGKSQGDIAALLGEVEEIAVGVKSVLRSLDSTTRTVNEIIGSRDFKRDIDRTMGAFSQAAVGARELVASNAQAINQSVANLRMASHELRGLVERQAPVVERILGNADAVSVEARQTISQLRGSLVRADTLLAHLDTIALGITEGEGVASKLLYDSTFAAELDTTVAMVQRLIDDIQQNGIRTQIKIGF